MGIRRGEGLVNELVMTESHAKVCTSWTQNIARRIKKCWMPFAITLIIIAVIFSLFRALTPWAKQYKGDLERHLSLLVGQPVNIHSMETSWYWFEPVLRLNQVTVLDDKNHVLRLSKLLVGINLFSSLWNWQIQPGILYIDDVHFTLREVNHRWQMDGLRQDKEVTTLDPKAYLPTISWLLRQQKIIIKNVSAMVHLNDGSLLPFSALNLTAINRNGHYRLKGEAELAQTMSTKLLILADMKLNPSALSEVSGHAYVSIHRFLPKQWQVFFPKTSHQLFGGKGNLEVWVDFLNGQMSGLQTTLDFRRLEWRALGQPESQLIQSIQANLAWSPTADGWEMSGDQIKLRADGIRWPDNSFLVRYQQSVQSYDVFIKTLLIQPLLNKDIDWSEIMHPLLAVHPRGQLEDLRFEIKDHQVNYVLGRFTEIGWQAQDHIPSVSNLSGVLRWQPQEGRLQLDSENTTIAPLGLPPIILSEVNAAFEWKELSQGLRVSMDRFLLSHPDLVVSAHGALEQALSPDNRHLQLSAEFSANQAQQWLSYVPSQILKSKLNDWLKHDIKRIEKASGQLNINGALADFPFEKQSGVFSVVSHLSGADLLFHRQWPPVKDIDLYLNVNQRTMTLDVLHATFRKIEVTNGNLLMDDMGLGKETLLLHTKAELPMNQLKDYILATPLRRHFSKLKKLQVKGPVGLDLRLEVPLYPENDDILARGSITLNNNQATFHHALNDVTFSDVMGILYFDEHGVVDSELKAMFLDEPVDMHLLSEDAPKSHTVISIDGETTIDSLHQKFDLPIFSFMKGHLKVNSQLIIASKPNDPDHLAFSTTLQGVNIDLPKPLGKSSDIRAPLTINVDLKEKKSARLQFNYDNRLSSDVWFTDKQGNFALDRGVVFVGRPVTLQKQSGIQIAGSLSQFDVQQWRRVWEHFPSHLTSSSFLDSVQHVNMTFGEVAVLGKNYPTVALKANKISNDFWSFQFTQKDIAGDLQYHFSDHLLSGRLSRLYLAKPSISGKSSNTSISALKPIDIPNIDVIIDKLRLGSVDVGSVSLKSRSEDTIWHLDNCKITSPEYQLALTGDWSLQEGKNKTTLQADMQVNHLGDGLKRWQVTPVVHAKKGVVQFKGGWLGTISDFKLEKTSGDMYMMFENGLITNLSKETEEKLGLGKLLSILSLQTIPRRLKLDFSDLSNPGYSFDVFKGNFSIKNGVMNTSDAYIDGPVAYASMKGDLDVVKQLYDIELHISPHITASLPIVATIAGGPIAGMATWVASKIINQGMQRVTGYTYKVSGPWVNPMVEQVSIYKHPLSKK